jgi:hypothetical protein
VQIRFERQGRAPRFQLGPWAGLRDAVLHIAGELSFRVALRLSGSPGESISERLYDIGEPNPCQGAPPRLIAAERAGVL